MVCQANAMKIQNIRPTHLTKLKKSATIITNVGVRALFAGALCVNREGPRSPRDVGFFWTLLISVGGPEEKII
jgi:hypothetical protein